MAFLFLTIRALHVLLAALWLGTAVFVAKLLIPAIEQADAPGGQVMSALVRRGFVTFTAAVSGTTVLTGIWLYWRFTSGFDPAISQSRAGLAFGAGAVAGLAAEIISGSVIGRGVKNLAALEERAARLPEGPERAALFQTIASARQRVASSSGLVMILLVFAMLLMSVGHYV